MELGGFGGRSGPNERVSLGGLTFDSLSEIEVIDVVLSDMARGTGGWLVNPNVDVLRTVHLHPDVRDLVSGADLIIADGMPILWAARLAGTPLPERVAGSDLIETLTAKAAVDRIGVFLLGGSEGAGEAAAIRLLALNPSLRIGWHCPPLGFESNEEAYQAIIDALAAFEPCVCYCALGFPKQERLMAALHKRFPASWFIGSGASVDFLAGAQTRAPVWMQKSGFEWSYRMFKEPRRLFRRYVVNDIPFAVRLLLTALIQRIAASR
jgi:exopolysaccharide biosynthesis WecB/TagA/CpsF family protein